MSEDHIGVVINGVLYVKFEDAKKLREGWDKADAEIEKLRAALKTARRDALEEAAQWHDEQRESSERGLEYSSLVGIPIANATDLRSSAKTHEWSAAAIRALGEKE